MRYSKQREAVYQVLCGTNTHPDVNWIYQGVRKIIPHVSLGTVYRNLAELVSCGRAHRVGVENSSERFDARTDPHAHYVCEKCRCVTDVELNQFDVNHQIPQVNRCEVIMYGVCNDCSSDQTQE